MRGKEELAEVPEDLSLCDWRMMVTDRSKEVQREQLGEREDQGGDELSFRHAQLGPQNPKRNSGGAHGASNPVIHGHRCRGKVKCCNRHRRNWKEMRNIRFKFSQF